MTYQKILPAVIVVSLIAGAGLAHGSISGSKQSVPASSGKTSPELSSSADPDMQDRHDRKEIVRMDRDPKDRDRHDIDAQDRESPEASMHHDGDDHTRGLARADFAQDAHREAVRDIMNASRVRVAMLYSPEHREGYHARMHRHSR